jgi:cell division protein FtsB
MVTEMQKDVQKLKQECRVLKRERDIKADEARQLKIQLDVLVYAHAVEREKQQVHSVYAARL